MSRYKKSSPVPIIAAVVLLGAFIGIVVAVTGGGEDEPEPVAPQYRYRPPAPVVLPPEPVAVTPSIPVEPPKIELSPAQAEVKLKHATAQWRAFALQLCKDQRWKTPKAVAFLEKVTWSDRDLAKQHAHGLAAIKTMLGMETDDTVAIAEELEGRGNLKAFFEKNWSKVDVGEVAEEAEVVALEDAWKPNRIRWGFPLDTPVETLQRFKMGGLRTATQVWASLVGAFVQAQQVDGATRQTLFLDSVGGSIKEREVKMHAAMRVLLEMPNASLRDVVQEFQKRVEAEGAQAAAQALAPKLEQAMEAARKAG
jgi:hypothetical protein